MTDKYVILDEQLDPEDYGVGGRLDDVSFINALSDAIKECKSEGITSEISEKWFGEDIVK
jgi:polar amino acid transport system substrate-binding protein